MNYTAIYNNLIDRSTNRVKTKGTYYENHHITPKCMGGCNADNNMVFLLPEEHFLAHLLLVKMYPTHHKLWYAANMMKSRVKSNKEYGWLKRRYSKINSLDRMGKPRTRESIEKQRATILHKMEMGYHHPNYGKPLSDEHKQNISTANMNKTVPIIARSSREGYRLRYGEEDGDVRYNEACTRKDSMSMNAFIRRHGYVDGVTLYEQRQQLMRSRTKENNPFFGKMHSDATKAKLKEAAKSRPSIKCPHCDKVGSAPLMKRWHFDRCKHIPPNTTLD